MRLIAVNDFYDTAKQEGSGGDINLALNNIKNELFSRDISAKVLSTLDIQRKNRHFAGRVPYGYLTGPTKHDIVVDEEAASVVKRIFHMAADKRLKTPEIARMLNADGILSPSAYKAKTRNYKGRVQPFWSGNSVYHILINRIYTGSFEMYKGHKVAVGSKFVKKVPTNQRTVIHNTHEAIVTEALFEEAQKMVRLNPSKRRKTMSNRPPEPMLARYLKCGCCGCKLFQTHQGDPHYDCHSARWRVDGDCDRVLCDAEALEPVVFHSIKTLVQLANQETQRNRTASQKAEAREAKLKNAVRSLKEKRKAINGKKVSLYEELKRGQLSLEGFKDAKEKCNAEEEMLKNQMEEQIAELARIRAEFDALNEAAEASSFPPITEDHLTPELLKTFVQKVIIHPDGNPEIVFKVKDEFCP